MLLKIFCNILLISVQASILILVVLIVKRLLRKRMGARWHHLIWLLPVIKLLVPYMPNSAISVFNLFSFEKPHPGNTMLYESGIWSMPASFLKQVGSVLNSPEATQNTPSGMTAETNSAGFPLLLELFTWIWLIGVVALSLFLLISSIRFKRFIMENRMPSSTATYTIIHNCMAVLGLKTGIRVIRISGLKSPAVTGLIKPTLLIPGELENAMGNEAFHHIILHELAHIKRKDLVLGWLTGVLNVIHWFNPLLWFAFNRMKLDREIACDALVLSHPSCIDRTKYGRTVLHAVRIFNGRANSPFSTALTGYKSHMKRRIEEIALFQPKSYKLSFSKVILLILLGVVLLTGAVDAKAEGLQRDTSPDHGATEVADYHLDHKKITAHYEIFYDKKDVRNIEKLAISLENNYLKLTGDLECNLDRRLIIKVWPDLKSFGMATGMDNVPYSMVSTNHGDVIELLSPSCYNGLDINHIAIHDLTHILIHNMNPGNQIAWIHGGLESFKAKELSFEAVKESIGSRARVGNIPKLEDLEDPLAFNDNYYAYSYTIAEFIESKWGDTKWNSLIIHPDQFTGVFGMDKNEFSEGWAEFLRSRYL